MNRTVRSRRHFVKTFVLGTAFSAAFGRVWEASVLADVTPSNVGLLRVKLSDFPLLLEDYGSVRIGINPIENPTGVLGPFYPILINHEIGSTYYAMSTFCSHAGCVVPPFDPSEGAIRCPCHGSGYAIDGSLVNGPASNPLITYPITFDGNDTLTVQVPSLGYCVNSSVVQGAEGPRLRLEFPTFFNVEYEVKFRQRVSDAWMTVPFSSTADGPAEQSSIVGDGTIAALFVDRTAATGFYSVAIRLIDLN